MRLKEIIAVLSLLLVCTCLLFPGYSLSAEDWFTQGVSFSKSGRYDQAIQAFSKAIEINPRNTSAYINRGLSWYHKGDYNQAIADYTKALEINPYHADAYNNLAWALAICPDYRLRNGAKAVEVAQKAVELNPEADTLDTLAAAYAEAGKFKEAIAIQKIVIALKGKEGKTEELAEYREHLKFYRANKPWREKLATLTEKSEQLPSVGIIKVRIARVREAPSLDSKVKFRLKKGARPSVVKIEGAWYLVELKDGRTGWAHQSLFLKFH